MNKLLISTSKLTIITMSAVVLLILGDYLLLDNGFSSKSYQYLVTGFLAIIAFNFILVSLQIKVKYVMIGSSIVFIAALFNTLSILYFTKEQLGNIPYLFDIIFMVGFSIGLRGLHLNTMKQRNQTNQLQLFSKISEMIYFEVDLQTDKVNIEFSEGFIQKYHLNYRELKITNDEFFSYIHPDDMELVRKISGNVEKNNESSVQFRIKYPGMANECWMFSRMFINDSGNLIGVDTDFTIIQKLQSNLDIKEQEQEYILESTTDLVAKVLPNGKILSASKSFTKVYPLTLNQIIGSTFADINRFVGVESQRWLKEIVKPPYTSTGVSQINYKGKAHWISWKNDAVLNKKGEVDYIVVVGHDITEITTLNKKLKMESTHDTLTGLINRRGLEEIKKSFEHVEQVVAFFIDLDNFNMINDFYGHTIGDEVLKLFANQLTQLNIKDCTICRLSGDEFLFIHAGEKDEAIIEQLKTLILKQTENIYTVDDLKITLDVSVGYAIYPNDTNEIDKLISYADLAMFEAKRNKYQEVIHFENSLLKELNHKVVMANKIKEAIDNQIIDVHFQPIIDTKDNSVSHLEALVRWVDHDEGFISPGVFLPIVQESGFMIKLDYYIIQKALNYFTQLKENEEYKNTTVTINVSPQTLLRDSFPRILSNMILKNNLNYHEVCIEISENTFVNNLQLCINQVHKIKAYGIIIALDDFGREYSSLAILDSMEFDIIKVDRLFIDKIESPKNLEIIKMILNISSFSNKIVIAEGVEIQAQKDKLELLGCHLLQGYYFSKAKKLI